MGRSRQAPKTRDEIEVADVVLGTDHVVFLANGFPRLISILTSAIFVSGTSGILSILKYRSVNPINSTPEDWFVTLKANGTKTRFKIDSGSQVNIILKKDYQLLKNKPGLKPTRIRLTVYNGTSNPVLGKSAVQIPHKKQHI